jgi:hypothetical protein
VAASYLVFFCAGPVDDDRADAILERIRALASSRSWTGSGPGWFDDPGADSSAERTTGGYVQVDDLEHADAVAVLDGARALAADLGIAVEVQWREDVIARF